MIDDTTVCNPSSSESVLDFTLPSLGRVGLNKIPPPRTYNLPPHYGLGISILLTQYGNLETNQWIKVFIDGQENFQLRYDYSYVLYGFRCIGTSTFSYPYPSEFYSASHTASTVTISFTTNVDQDVSDQGFLIRNVRIYLDQCDPSCASCNGKLSNNCTACPVGSPVNGVCSCSPGTVPFDHSCVATCPSNYYYNSTIF